MFRQVADNKGPASGITRRRFVQGLMVAGTVAGFDLWRWPSLAQENPLAPTILRGNHFDLVIQETRINFTGRTLVATTINGSVPGPTLRWRRHPPRLTV
jgi:FtsP/CotA-like multicopper oxidase with cupredoxin domain